MLTDKLGSIYAGIEEKWFELLKALQEKGIPAYSYAEFLESRGIPSLPFTIAIIILLLVILFSFSFGGAYTDVSLTVTIRDDQGQSLSDVKLELYNDDGQTLKSETVQSGYKIELKRVKIGSTITASASKSGYRSASAEKEINSKTATISITLKREARLVSAKVRLIDELTSTLIRDARCEVSFDKNTLGITRDYDGLFLVNVPQKTDVVLKCTANGYEDLQEAMRFDDGEIKVVKLKPKSVDVNLSTLLISVYDEETKQLIKGTSIRIINSSTGVTITDINSQSGDYTEKIKINTQVRIIVEKAGYMSYVEDFTIRTAEVVKKIYLKKGGAQLIVNVTSKDGIVQVNADVSLFDSNFQLVSAKKTAVLGNAAFDGIDPNRDYYFNAFKEGFLPAYGRISAGTKSLDIKLEKPTAQNSALVKITVRNSSGNITNNAALKYYRIINAFKIPLGIPVRKTGLTGTIIETLPEGTFLIAAETEVEYGEKEITVMAGIDQQVDINMSRKPNFVELRLIDGNGMPLKGEVIVKSKSGKTLFAGNVNGGAIFDSEMNESFLVSVKTPDGKTFEQEVRVGANNVAEVRLGADKKELTDGVKPIIEFAGVFDSGGKSIEGVTAGEFAWLRFNVSFPQGEKTGIHIRVGPDSIASADAQEIGIFGFDGNASSFVYGKSYQAPLGEQKDLASKGAANERNKWLELYFNKAPSQTAVSIKVKTDNISREKDFEVHYRAWSEIGTKVFRDPADSVLGNEKTSNAKQALYAETKIARVKVFEGKASCSEELCIALALIDSNNVKVKEDGFSAVEGQTYALEISVNSGKKMSAEIVVRSENSNVLLSELTEDVLSFSPKGEFSKTELRGSLKLEANSSKIVRAYFKGKSAGTATLEALVRSGDLNANKKISFNVTGSKEMLAEIYKKGEIKAGEKLRVTLRDSETKDPITNAFVSITREGEVLLSTTGNNTNENGANGIYVLGIDKLSPGKYVLTAKAVGYKDASFPIVISAEKLLSIEPQLEIMLNKGEKQRSAKLKLTNGSFDVIDKLGYEVKGLSGDTSDFNIIVALPPKIDVSRTIDIEVVAIYKGDVEKRAYAEFELIVSGSENPVVTAKSKIKVSYNKEIPPECIEIDKSEAEMHFSGIAGSAEVLPLTITYKNEAFCNKPLTFTPKMKSDDDKLVLSAQPFTIVPGENKTIELKITNNAERVGVFEQKVEATVFLEAPEVTKSISLGILFTDPAYALQTNDNIPIFMSFDVAKGSFSGTAPLFAKNFGKKVIENIRWSVKPPQQIEIYITSTTGSGSGQPQNIPNQQMPGMQNFMQAPNTPYIQGNPSMAGTQFAVTLAPGEEMEPKTVLATSTAANLTRGPHKGEIILTGTVDGKQFQKVVSIWVFVSTAQCIKVAPADELYFSSEDSSQGVIAKKITIKNECGEVARNFILKPQNLGNNTLSITLLGNKDFLYPDESAQAQIVLTKRGDYFNAQRPDNIIVSVFLVNSQKFVDSNPLPVLIEVGKKPDVSAGPVYKEVQIPVCGETSSVKKSVQFPVMSADIGCDSGYCDAVQLSGYIVERIKGVMQKVDKVLQQNDLVSSYAMCSQLEGFCSFSAMGIVPEVYTVYMRNDSFGKEVLQRRVESSKEFATFVTEYFQGDVSEIVKSATGFTTSKIFMTKPLVGCGRYKISIQGAVQNIQGRLSRENYFILVKIVEDRKVTPECMMRIQNIANFLPLDRGLAADKHYNTWLGTTEGLDATRKAAELFAQKLFDDKSRVNVAYHTNKLKVILGEIPESGIAKISMNQVSQQQAQPATLGVTINKLYVTLDEKMQDEMIAKASEALKQLMEGSFTVEGCITKDDSALVISKLEHTGDLDIEKASDTIELYYSMPMCVDMNVVSTVLEPVVLKTSFASMKDNEKAGIQDVWIEVDGKRISEYSERQEGTPITLEKEGGEESKKFKKSFKLCVKANDAYFELAAGKKIGVKARSVIFATKEMRSWKEVTLELCGIHPYKLIQKMSNEKVEPGKSKVFYATVGWKGEPNEIDFAATTRGLTASDRLKRAQELMEDVGKGGRIDDSPIGQKILGLKRQGYGLYFGACLAVSFICHVVTGLDPLGIRALINAMIDCLPATIGGLFGTTKAGQGFQKALNDAWEKVKSNLRWFYAPWSSGKATPNTEAGLYGQAMDEFWDNAVPAAILGFEADWLATELRSYVYSRGWANKTIGSTEAIDTIAEQMAKDATQKFTSKYLKGVTTAASDDFINAFTPQLQSSLQESISSTLRKNSSMTFGKLIQDKAVMQSMWQKATSDEKIKTLVYSKGFGRGAEIEKLISSHAEDFLRKSVDPKDIKEIFGSSSVSQEDLAKAIVDQIDSAGYKTYGVRLTKDVRKGLISSAKKGISKGHIYADSIEGQVNNALKHIHMDRSNELMQIYGQNVLDNLDDVMAQPKQPGAFKRMIEAMKTRSFWARLAKSIACGAVSNAAGYAAYSSHVKGGIEELMDKGYIPEAGVSVGDPSKLISGYTGPKLMKNRTYKITISKDDYGNISYNLELVDTEKEIEEMRAAISKNPSALWREDCKEYREKGLSEMVGCLAPKTGDYIKPEEVVAYYKNSGFIREASIQFNVHEALIMAALTTRFENFEPCPVNQKWYEGEDSERKLTIKCVAMHISEKLAANQDNIRSAFEVLSKERSADKARAYAMDVEAKYRMWKTYDTCKGEGG
ncbi:MAG: carboxypeptidase-like regulatory domain-containing protein [Candidatus Diapherotrites archaeon]|nr:carboxypeptidase-like regulatory domain-containing protein [Candidatus Diapherotrites archaeon]